MKNSELTLEQKIKFLDNNLLKGMVIKGNDGELYKVFRLDSNTVTLVKRYCDAFNSYRKGVLKTVKNYSYRDYSEYRFVHSKEEILDLYQVEKLLTPKPFKNLWERERYSDQYHYCEHGWEYRWNVIEQKLENYTSSDRPKDSYKSVKEKFNKNKYILQCVENDEEYRDFMSRIQDEDFEKVLKIFPKPSKDVYNYVSQHFLTYNEAHALFYRS